MSRRRPPAARFAVVGAFVADCLVDTRRPPAWGESREAHSVRLAPGGKALNQAVALARLGADVDAIGAVGDDAAGQMVLDALRREGVLTDFLEVRLGAATPICVCLRQGDGETAFLWQIDPAVAVTPATVKAGDRALASASTVIVTYEMPEPAVSAAIAGASGHGTRVLVHPAPVNDAVASSALAWDDVDVLFPNELEARRLLAELAEPDVAERPPAELAGELARATGVETVVVTLGPLGCAVHGPTYRAHQPAPHVDGLVDATGASDALVATLAVGLDSGLPLEQAVQEAQRAAARTLGQAGGYEAMPARSTTL